MEMFIKEIPFSGQSTDLVEEFLDQPHLFFLDSSLRGSPQGRYSFIGFDPYRVVSTKGIPTIETLKEHYSIATSKPIVPSTPLPCGMVGFMSYDYGLIEEKINRRALDDQGLPDVCFGFYDCIITIDHLLNKAIVTSSGLPERDERLKILRARERFNFLCEKIEYVIKHKASEYKPREINNITFEELPLKGNFTKEQYVSAVKDALKYIEEGDIYQVNLSQRFEMEFGTDIENMFMCYKILRECSPSHYGVFYKGDDFTILSSSPERFLKLEDGMIQAKPMKGTRPRGINKDQDKNFRNDIVHSPKENAELLMITDLERNDIGKVAEFGSVRVSQIRTIEAYSTVFQATSTVEGELEYGKDAFDLLKACFPGGSITGCPKIRAMDIIEELEPTTRGVYTGTFGYLSFDGTMDTNILIRTMVGKENSLYFQVGGGIVSDSTPEEEYDETLVKARAMCASIKQTLTHSDQRNLWQ